MRLIDADALKKDIETEWLTPQTKMAFFKIVDDAPTMNLEKTSFMQGYNYGCDDGKRFYERPQGEWKFIQGVTTQGLLKCPFCDYRDYHKTNSNYCPVCGAKMKGSAE